MRIMHSNIRSIMRVKSLKAYFLRDRMQKSNARKPKSDAFNWRQSLGGAMILVRYEPLSPALRRAWGWLPRFAVLLLSAAMAMDAACIQRFSCKLTYRINRKDRSSYIECSQFMQLDVYVGPFARQPTEYAVNSVDGGERRRKRMLGFRYRRLRPRRSCSARHNALKS